MKPKIKVAFVLFALLSILLSQAQTRKHEIGIIGGAGASFIRGEYMLQKLVEPPLFAFAGGISYQYNFNAFSLNTNILFERKGTKGKINYTNEQGEFGGKADFYLNYNYLTIPILAKISLGNKIKFTSSAGPSFSFLISWYHFLISFFIKGKLFSISRGKNILDCSTIGISFANLVNLLPHSNEDERFSIPFAMSLITSFLFLQKIIEYRFTPALIFSEEYLPK